MIHYNINVLLKMIRNKKRKPKELRNNIDFRSIIKYFAIGFSFYIWVILFLILYLNNRMDWKFHDTLLDIMVLPFPLFIMVLLILLEKNKRITRDNKEVQEEIKRIKQMYQIRKTAEDLF